MEENASRARNFTHEPPYLDLYHLQLTLHYVWPRCAPHRPNRSAQTLSRPDCWDHWEVLVGCLQSSCQLPDCNTTRQAMRDLPHQVPSISFQKPRPSRDECGVHNRTV